MNKKTIGLIFVLLLTSCSIQSLQNTLIQKQDDKIKILEEESKKLIEARKNFRTKSTIGDYLIREKEGSFQDDDAGINYIGKWNYNTNYNPSTSTPTDDYLSDVSGGFSAKLSGDLTDSYNTNPLPINVNINSNWLTETNVTSINPINRDYKYTNGEPYLLVDNNSSEIKYSPSDFIEFASNHKSNGQSKVLENTGLSNPNSTFFNLSYNSSLGNSSTPQEQYGWKTKGSYTYNFSKSSTNQSITFEFEGTNISLYAMKGRDPGWNDIKVTIIPRDSSGNFDENSPEKITEIVNMFNNTNVSDKFFQKNGLKFNRYKVKLESAPYSRSTGKVSFLFSFDKAVVYPSIEYKITDSDLNNISYKARKNNYGGLVKIFIDGIYQTTINLYNPSDLLKYVYTYIDRNYSSNSETRKHRITIEATGEKDNSSLGTEINIDEFGQLPRYLKYLGLDKEANIVFIKNQNFGNADIFVNSQYYETVSLNSSSLMNETKKIIFTSNSDNKINIIPSYDINNENKIGIDFISSGEHKAEFKVITSGTGDLAYFGAKGKDNGKVKISLFNYDTNTLISSVTDNLYSSTPDNKDINNTLMKRFDDIPAGRYKLVIEPTYTKENTSTGYYINVDQIKFVRKNPDNPANVINTYDTICTP